MRHESGPDLDLFGVSQYPQRAPNFSFILGLDDLFIPNLGGQRKCHASNGTFQFKTDASNEAFVNPVSDRHSKPQLYRITFLVKSYRICCFVLNNQPRQAGERGWP